MADEEGPPQRDVLSDEFKFMQMCKMKAFDEEPETLTPKDAVHLLAVSDKYGYTFVGCDTGVKVVRTFDLIKLDADYGSRLTVEDVPCIEKVPLPVMPCHVALSSDNLTLSVCYQHSTGTKAEFFDIRNLADPNKDFKAFVSVQLIAGNDVSLRDLCWNPDSTENADVFAVCLTDGSLSLWQVDVAVAMLHSLDADNGINAICWSPNGEQIVGGTLTGRLVQYSKSLEIKKEIEPPIILDNGQLVISVIWLSTYSFLAAYNAIDSAEQPNLVEVNTSEYGPTTFINLKDVCFGESEDRDPVYYFVHVPEWDMVVTAQSNAMECVPVGQKPEGGWERWNLHDACRVEMPLLDSEETYPMGMAFALTPQIILPIGVQQAAPTSPMLITLSTGGMLCPFYMVKNQD